MGQGRLLFEIFAVQRGRESETGQRLETVADADDQLAGLDELFQLLMQPEFQPVGEHGAGTEMVAERETADERQDMEFLHRPFAVQQVVQMDLFGGRAGGFERGGGFLFAIQAQTRDDQGFDFGI